VLQGLRSCWATIRRQPENTQTFCWCGKMPIRTCPRLPPRSDSSYQRKLELVRGRLDRGSVTSTMPNIGQRRGHQSILSPCLINSDRNTFPTTSDPGSQDWLRNFFRDQNDSPNLLHQGPGHDPSLSKDVSPPRLSSTSVIARGAVESLNANSGLSSTNYIRKA